MRPAPRNCAPAGAPEVRVARTLARAGRAATRETSAGAVLRAAAGLDATSARRPARAARACGLVLPRRAGGGAADVDAIRDFLNYTMTIALAGRADVQAALGAPPDPARRIAGAALVDGSGPDPDCTLAFDAGALVVDRTCLEDT